MGTDLRETCTVDCRLFKVSPVSPQYISFHKNMLWRLEEWIKHHNLICIPEGEYINVYIQGYDAHELFNPGISYAYMDGFSPNLNKKLHIGHLANFIVANALNGLLPNTAPIFIANCVEGATGEYRDKVFELMGKNNYCPIRFYPTAHAKVYKDSWLTKLGNKVTGTKLPIKLIPGTGKYEGTRCVEIEGNPYVCIKSNGDTNYLFEDLLMLHSFESPILYVTGKEQKTHFELLSGYGREKGGIQTTRELIHHLPVGHVQIKGIKMGTRFGNVQYAENFLYEVANKLFGNNEDLAWNAIMGEVLKSDIKTDKKINVLELTNQKVTTGLYLSYTLARLQKAGLHIATYAPKRYFNDSITDFAFWKASVLLKPNLALERLRVIAKDLNAMYQKGGDYTIKTATPEILKEYTDKAVDLYTGMRRLGMRNIKKV